MIQSMSFFSKLFGDYSQKIINKLQPLIHEIASLESQFEQLDDASLRSKTAELRAELANGKTLDDLLPKAFALVREAGKRSLGMRHFDEQIIGGIILHQGKIAEMRTGEGKTLVATLPLYLNALTGNGAHLITVNDYLARLHTVWMGKLYWALGISTACIVHDSAFIFDPDYKKKEAKEELAGVPEVVVDVDFLKPVSRKEAYAADITYGTNNEFGFDYLRDNMVPSRSSCVQRELHYAIVDEVDSILIDEARTPLIISAPAEESAELYYRFAKIARGLRDGIDYTVDEKMKSTNLTEDGLASIEKTLGITNLYAEGGIDLVRHMEASLKAEVLFKKDRDYVVRNGEIVIVDEFTGRMMFGRRYSEGLHQALEAKEGLEIQKESRTLATVTIQNYFRLYKKLSGMTGTAVTEAEEFHKIYNLDVVAIPTHKPMIREDATDKIYKSEQGKLNAVVEEVKARNALGQPVLVGTVSISKNEQLSELLTNAGVNHEVLNAKNHEREAEIIAQAGKVGAVTIATNMAGRGVDIILGGNPPDKHESEVVKNLGGLCVIGTERHESRRIDNQLRGRAGRQGDPGTSQFYLSMEDDLMRIFGSDRVKSIMNSLGLPEDVPIQNRFISRSIETAQKKVEGHHFDTRKHLVEYDDVINKHRETIYKKRRRILELYEEESRVKSQESKEENIAIRDSKLVTRNHEQVADRQLASSIREEILMNVRKEIEDVVGFHTASEGEWNMDSIYESCDAMFTIPINVRLKLEEFPKDRVEAKTKIIAYLFDLAHKRLDERVSAISESLQKQGIQTDVLRELGKQVCLNTIDALWMDHIDAVDHLRTGIGLRGYGQRDPLVEYKREAFRMFTLLLASIQRQTAYGIFKLLEGTVTVNQPQPAMERKVTYQGTNQEVSGGQVSKGSGQQEPGRNDPCPCGSINPATGQTYKYKKCGLINAPYHRS